VYLYSCLRVILFCNMGRLGKKSEPWDDMCLDSRHRHEYTAERNVVFTFFGSLLSLSSDAADQVSCIFMLTMMAQNKLNPARVSANGTEPLDRSFSEEPKIHQKKKAREGAIARRLYITMASIEYFSLTSKPQKTSASSRSTISGVSRRGIMHTACLELVGTCLHRCHLKV